MSGCCTTLPKISIPLQIVPPDSKLPVVKIPQHWQPVALNHVTLVFTQEPSQLEAKIIESKKHKSQKKPKAGEIQTSDGGQMVEPKMIENKK